MSREKGYILLYRDICTNWIWEDKPFSKGQAFIDLILRANHNDNSVLFGNQIIEVKRGEIITSIAKLSDAWGWSRHKTKLFLNLLTTNQMISHKTDNKKTVVKVLNYDVYQNFKNTKGHQKFRSRTSKNFQADINGTQTNNYNTLINNEEINIDAPSGAKKSGLGRGGGHTDF